jgi:tetratricopeptide (TPR) repeat protein/putative ribosome biogenesis GTPase RsgA
MLLQSAKFSKLITISVFILFIIAGATKIKAETNKPNQTNDGQQTSLHQAAVQRIAEKFSEKPYIPLEKDEQGSKLKETNNNQSFEQILSALHNNDPHLYAIDLSHLEALTQVKMQQLSQAIDNNPVIGYIQWGELSTDCEQIQEHIQEKLISNIAAYTYYPNDYIHGLLAYQVYNNPISEQKIDLTVLSKELGHQLPASTHTTWKAIQIQDDSIHTGYYSALYVNEFTHQAVLAFQGTKVEGLKDLLKKNSDLKEDIDSVLGNAITQQNALAYVATKNAVDYVRENEYNLSITGHSLGGYLAELAVAFCYRDFSYRQTKGIVFDSPGTVNKLDKFKSNVINKATKFSIASLPIVTYLSAPNLINTCNGHPGEVYRVYPQLMWSAEIQKWMKRASKLPLIGSAVQGNNKGLLALTGHSLATILVLFDPATGKPSTYTRIADWPKIDTDNVAYIGKQKEALEKKSLLKTGLSLLTGKTNIVGGAFQMLPSLIGGTAASVLSVLKDYVNINQSQYVTTLAYLDDTYKETKLNTQKEFNLRYKGHYRVSDKAMNEHILYTENYEGVDWYLYELYKYKDKLAQSPTRDITFAVLKNVVQEYEVVSLDEQPYIRLAAKQGQVEALRDKMQRSLKVLSAASIKKTLEDSNIDALTKQLEKRSIKQFSQLHNYIAQAKLTTYLAREDKQQELHQKLEKSGVCVVYGHGGVGKSTLVAQYGHNQKDKQLIWWMQAETSEKLIKSYQDLAQELGIDYQKLAQGFKQSYDNYLPELSKRVYNALEDRKQPTLLILDNAADANLVAGSLLYRPDLVQVVITTRKARDFKAYSQVELAAFKREEGEKYIKNCFESSLYKPNEQEIAVLIKEVGLIPQRLALAVGYIGQKRLMTIQGYIGKLQAIKKLGKKGEHQFVLPEVSLGLESLEPQAQLVMRYGAYLDPDFIPLSLIIALVEVKDEEVLEGLLATLEGLSLITIIKGQGNELGIQIHREVQEASRQYQGWDVTTNLSEETLLSSIIKVLHERMPWVTEVPDHTWDQAKIYATNVVHILSNIGQATKPTAVLADLMGRLGNYNQQVERNFSQALKYNLQALETRKILYSGTHLQVAESLDNLGSTYKVLGQYQEALQYYQQALEIRKALYNDNHVQLAESFNNVGLAYKALGQYQEAIVYLKQALEMRKALYTGNHPHIAESLNNAGAIYKVLGQYQESLKYYQQALEMRQALYTGNHPHIAQSFNNLGLIYKALGQYREALKYLKQGLEMRKALYTAKHHRVAQSYNNVGSVYKSLKQYQDALKYYQQALDMKRSLYMGNHPSIAISLNNIGNIHTALGQYHEALKYLKQALEMRQVLFTGNHPQTAISLNDLGDFYQASGEYQEALRYYQQAFAMRQALYTSNHPDIATSLNNLGYVYQALGQHQEALKYYQQALDIWRSVYVGNHPKIAISLNNLGSVYQALGKHQEAAKYYQQALDMRKTLYPCNHPDIVASLSKLENIYTTLGEHQEALKYYQQALEMRQALYKNK